MSLTIRQQAMWWGAALFLLLLSLIVLDQVLLPYLVGLAIAYLLDPLADRLERLGCSRFWATAIISVTALLFVLAGIILLIPLLFQQLAELTLFVPAGRWCGSTSAAATSRTRATFANTWRRSSPPSNGGKGRRRVTAARRCGSAASSKSCIGAPAVAPRSSSTSTTSRF